eukprot:6197120-Pleurochrysis_carterae.AAC.2
MSGKFSLHAQSESVGQQHFAQQRWWLSSSAANSHGVARERVRAKGEGRSPPRYADARSHARVRLCCE